MNMYYLTKLKFFETPKPDKYQLARQDAKDAHILKQDVKEVERKQQHHEEILERTDIQKYDAA